MAINKSSVSADTWTAVNNALKSLFSGENIYARFPEDTSKMKKSDFPIVVQKPAEVSTAEKLFGRVQSPKDVVVLIEIYSNNPADIDSRSDTIRNYFETTNVDGIGSPVVNESDVGELIINNWVVSFKILALSFVN